MSKQQKDLNKDGFVRYEATIHELIFDIVTLVEVAAKAENVTKKDIAELLEISYTKVKKMFRRKEQVSILEALSLVEAERELASCVKVGKDE